MRRVPVLVLSTFITDWVPKLLPWTNMEPHLHHLHVFVEIQLKPCCLPSLKLLSFIFALQQLTVHMKESVSVTILSTFTCHAHIWMTTTVTHTLMCGVISHSASVYVSGGDFLRKFARVSNSSGQWKCAFCLTRDGKTVKIQRTIFSECFYIMAIDELSRVTGDKDMQVWRN